MSMDTAIEDLAKSVPPNYRQGTSCVSCRHWNSNPDSSSGDCLKHPDEFHLSGTFVQPFFADGSAYTSAPDMICDDWDANPPKNAD